MSATADEEEVVVVVEEEEEHEEEEEEVGAVVDRFLFELTSTPSTTVLLGDEAWSVCRGREPVIAKIDRVIVCEVRFKVSVGVEAK